MVCTGIVMRAHLTILTTSLLLIVVSCGLESGKKIAWTKFVPLCEGIEGIIGDLKIDDAFEYESVMLPIDTLVVDLTKDAKKDEDFFAAENI